MFPVVGTQGMAATSQDASSWALASRMGLCGALHLTQKASKSTHPAVLRFTEIHLRSNLLLFWKFSSFAANDENAQSCGHLDSIRIAIERIRRITRKHERCRRS